jgi:hypothetical protein
MVTLLLFAFALAIFAVIGIGLFFWQKSTPDDSERVLPPLPDPRGLFGETLLNSEEEMKMAIVAQEAEQAALIARAQNDERSALDDAHQTKDTALYDRVLTELLKHADSDAKLLSLMSYVTKNELPVNPELATAVLDSWQKSPNRSGTSKALHFAALSDDAAIYQGAVEQALRFWREGKLSDVSAIELRALFDGEFWILSSRTRSSGAGFVLKRTLDSARRELEAAASATQ